jgi:heterodisulfide reductase subunit A
VDCDKLVDYAKKLGNVVVSKSHSFLCTESGQNEIIQDIKEKKLNRIVATA